MLTWIVLLFAVVLFVVLPLGVLKRYYRPSSFSLKSVLWLITAIITWPLVPVGIAYLKGDRLYLSLFWVSFLFFIVSCSYWLVLHVNEYIAVQDMLSSKLGM